MICVLFSFLFFYIVFISIIITWKKHRAYDIFLACIFAIANIKFDYLCFSHWSCLRLFLLWFSLLSNSCMLVRDKYSVGYLFCHLFSHRAPTVLSSANRIHRICCCWCCFFSLSILDQCLQLLFLLLLLMLLPFSRHRTEYVLICLFYQSANLIISSLFKVHNYGFT